MGANRGHSQWDVLNLATVGNWAKLDDGVKGHLQPRQLFLWRLKEVTEQAPESYK